MSGPDKTAAEIEAAIAAGHAPPDASGAAASRKAGPPPRADIDESEDDDDDEDDEEDEDGDEDEDEDSEAERLSFSARDAWLSVLALGRFLAPYLRGRRRALALLLGGVVVESAFNVAFPLSLMYLIDSVLESGSRGTLVAILAVLAGFALLVSVVSVAYEWANAKLSGEVCADIRQHIFDQTQRVELGLYDRIKSGQVLSRFSSDMASIQELVMHGVDWGLFPLVELIGAVALLFYLSPEMALVALLIFPLTLIGPRLIAPRAVEANYQLNRREAALLAVASETVGAQPLVRAFSLEGIAAGWYRRRNDAARRMATEVRFLDALVERSVTISVLLLHLLVFGVGALLAYDGVISIGTFVAFEAVFWELSYNIAHVTQFIPDVIESAGAVRHINDLLGEPKVAPDAADAVTAPRLAGELRFERLCFSYDGGARQIDDLSFAVAAGSRVAIVGESGAGKSTLLALLMRLREPSAGRILLDGLDIRKMTRESLRGQLAVVFQDNLLFGTTVRENIGLGRPDASDGDIVAAAKAASIHSFIMTLPQRYDTVLGERGNTLSGGQRQRLAIARAIVRNPAILLLDEATSGLDSTTEAAIVKTLSRVSQGRTLITVTHRLRSIAHYDHIIVLAKGRVAQQGRHEELLAAAGIYRDLWRQGGGEA